MYGARSWIVMLGGLGYPGQRPSRCEVVGMVTADETTRACIDDNEVDWDGNGFLVIGLTQSHGHG